MVITTLSFDHPLSSLFNISLIFHFLLTAAKLKTTLEETETLSRPFFTNVLCGFKLSFFSHCVCLGLWGDPTVYRVKFTHRLATVVRPVKSGTELSWFESRRLKHENNSNINKNQNNRCSTSRILHHFILISEISE